MDEYTYLNANNIELIDDLYKRYKEKDKELDTSWITFFQGFDFSQNNYSLKEEIDIKTKKEFNVINLINAYRQRGHLFTKTNPVRSRRDYKPNLDISNFGLLDSDLNNVFHAAKEIGLPPSSLRDIVSYLKETYCKSIGIEYTYISNPKIMEWLRNKMETTKNTVTLTPLEKKHIFHHLNTAVGLEQFIHKNFTGQKRFSLEGTETLIPALDEIIEYGANIGLSHFFIGMSHRGRLNVLTNILKKPYENVFEEFNGTTYAEGITLGDVKYHLGYQNTINTDTGKKVSIKLVPNPSHLESVAPVTTGLARGYIDLNYDNDNTRVVPIIIHGDAAIAAQGVVYETIQMSKLDAYQCGGTIHLIINNQIGFTTNYTEGRSSTYCTDIAKVTRSPVFHVNGDDVEALIYCVRTAIEYRQKFHSDIFIDILSYRKYGHNEGDEPRFTQPLLYRAIEKHPSPREIYGKKLVEENIMNEEEVYREIRDFEDLLEKELQKSKENDLVYIKKFMVEETKDIQVPQSEQHIPTSDTSITNYEIENICNKITNLPTDRSFFRKILKLNNSRKKLIQEKKLDWALAELLAYGSLVNNKYTIRLSGQDSERGTFSHRHAAFTIVDTDKKYFPLHFISKDQAPCNICNSHLSEYGVLGFEYGYAMANIKGLTIWEAQFGDFSNVAQVMFDQYISTAYEKWGLPNNITLFLPHGYEGQGSEHSSARIERILLLCANNNMRLVNCTTPSNFFHILRNQAISNIKIPLIAFTPKSLLRHPDVISDFKEITDSNFKPIITEENPSANIHKIIFTSGKLYYDIHKERIKKRLENKSLIVRIEQIYPFPYQEIKKLISRYPNVQRIWAQDEPLNMGVWPFICLHYSDLNLKPKTRPVSASPAIGLIEQHKKRLQLLLDEILN